MFKIVKYASSGVWYGQTYKRFDTHDDAKAWLDAKAIRSAKLGREACLSDCNTFLEITDDEWADAFQYYIEKDE